MMGKSLSRRNLLRQLTGGMVTAAFPAFPAFPALTRRGVLLVEVPGKPDRPICLSRNENAYGPSGRAVAAMQEATANAANRYPELECEALRSKIAAYHGVAPDQVVLGCGSTEIMRTAVDAFAAGKKLITALPTVDVLSGFAHRAGAEVVASPLTRTRGPGHQAMLEHIDARTGLVYISNPNNVTGGLTPRRDIEAFIGLLPPTVFVLIDEAYHHYVGNSAEYASFIDRPLDDHRVIVTRSFSRIYGLAGLRVGYGVAVSATARALASQRVPDGVNVAAAKAALAALDDTAHVRTSVRRNADDRQEFRNQANARMLRTIDSQANFVMLNAGPTAAELVRRFDEHEITLPQPFPSMREYIRVSLGTAAEMHEFWRVWDLVATHGMSRM